MADDLGDDWWKENDEHPKGKNEEKTSGPAQNENEETRVENSENIVAPPPKKRKRYRRRITEAKLPNTCCTAESLKLALQKHFNKLTALEVEEISLDDGHFAVCNKDNDYTVPSYLKAVLPKWHRLSPNFTHKMSPLVLIICGNALRASHLNTDAKLFKGENCKSIKLFSRHMKIEEQIKTLKKNVIHFAVGTPERVRSLMLQDALSLSHTRVVVIDWTWRDSKMKTINDLPQVRQSLMLLLKDHVIPACKIRSVKLGLF